MNRYARDMREIRKARVRIKESVERLARMSVAHSYETRLEALEALNDCEIELEPYVRKAMSDRDELVRTTAAEIAGERRLLSLRDRLIRQLNSDHSRLVRSAAAVALGDMNAVEARGALKERISVSGDWERNGIYYALVKLGVERNFDYFLSGLKHDSYIVRCATASLLPGLVNVKNRAIALKSLKVALLREQTVAARSSIEDAIEEIRMTRKRSRYC
ncbi:MAG: HEAT repeat domain-containing protein [Candidatus Binataceae bacterium]